MIAKPTGAVRFTTVRRLFREPVLALEIEETYIHTSSFGGHIESEQRTHWRLARTEDLNCKWFPVPK